MTGAASRARGARCEVAVVNHLRRWWPDARRYLAGDGRQPGDVDFHPLVCLEVKDRAASAWPTWERQAADEARPGMAVAVVRRTRGNPNPGTWETRVRIDAVTVDLGLSGTTDRQGWLRCQLDDLIAALVAHDQGANT